MKMGIIILGLVCVALAILGWILESINERGNWFVMGLLFSVLYGFMVVMLIAASINLDKRFEVGIADYNSLKQTIQCSRESNSEFERVELIKQIHETNKAINEHRIMHGNFWTGIWYSEEIGKLELLK